MPTAMPSAIAERVEGTVRRGITNATIASRALPTSYRVPKASGNGAVKLLRHRDEETEIARDIRSLLATLPPCDSKEEAFVVPVAKEDGFTLSFAQFGAGLRLAVSDVDGQILACPHCGKRRLVVAPHKGIEITVCAEALGAIPCADSTKFPRRDRKGRQKIDMATLLAEKTAGNTMELAFVVQPEDRFDVADARRRVAEIAENDDRNIKLLACCKRAHRSRRRREHR